MPETLESKLSAARLRWRGLRMAGGLAASVALLCALMLLSFHSDRLVVLSNGGRLGWLIGLVVGLAAALLAFVLIPVRRRIPDEAVAAEVERKYPALNERLLTTVTLANSPQAAGVSGAMVGHLARETERLSAPLNFAQAIPTRPVRLPVAMASALGLLFLGHTVIAPQAMQAWANRILHPGADIPIYANTKVRLTPEMPVVPRGESFSLDVTLGGRLTDTAVLHYQFEGASPAKTTLKPLPAAASGETTRRFTCTFDDVQQNVTLYATAGDGHTNPLTIRVEDRPTVLDVHLRLTYPDYMHRPAETLDATTGNIVAPVGTRVQVETKANKLLADAHLLLNGKESGAWAVENETARGSLTVTKDQSYAVRLVDRNGWENLAPPQYTIRAQPDQPPVVRIEKPGLDMERTPQSVVSLRVVATDDYGVQSLGIAYEIGTRKGNLPLAGANGQKEVAVGGAWSLGSLALKPGEEIVYAAVAKDGDTVSGAHTGKSATFRIRIVSVAELKERTDAAIAQEREALNQLVQRQKEAQALLAKARQQPQKTENLAAAQAAERSISQEAEELSRRMQQTSETLRDNNLASQSQQKRRDETQKAVENLAQKQMPRAADTIQQAEQQPGERPNSLANAAQQEQAIQKELERIARENAKAPEAGELAKEADQLAQAQQKLAEKADLLNAQREANPANQNNPKQMTPQEREQARQLAKEQADLKAQTDALQKQVNEAARDAKETGKPNAAALQKAAQQMQKAQTAQKQSGAQQDLQKGQPSDAANKQNEAAQDLQKLAEQLDPSAAKKPNDAAMQKQADALNKLADKLHEMAREQQQVARDAQFSPDKQTAQKLADQEQKLGDQAQQAGQSLKNQPSAQQALQRAQQQMSEAKKQLQDGQSSQATPAAREAVRQLLRAEAEARDAARQMEQQQGAEQAQKQFEQMAKEQRQLQKQTQALDEARKNGTSLTPEQARQADALQKKQNALLGKTRGMNAEMPTQGFKWAAEEAAKRMDRANNGLQQKNTGSETQRQQEQAAQTLERIARSLKQEAEGARQQQMQQESGQQSQADQQMADAAGELQLSREMQSQIRQETGSLNQQRQRNPNGQMTAGQQRELNDLRDAQRETQRIAERAARQLRGSPQISQKVQDAAQKMEEVRDQLDQQQTGQPTQGRQQEIVQMLDQAIQQTRQAMREQRQQMAQQGQQPGQQPGQQMAQQSGGNTPGKRDAPIEKAKLGRQDPFDQRGKGFTQMTPRAQQSLREGRQERIPAEYRDLVERYYKALSERGK